ncbi:MAG: T9SS type A sorting domain-containing protein [Gelidibacter sp.]
MSTDGGTITSNYGIPNDNGNNSWTVTGIPNTTNVILTVTNAYGCDNSLVVQAPDCVCIELEYEYTDVSCFGLNDGTIIVNYVTEGAEVTINGQPYDANTLYAPGIYTIKAYFEGNDREECIITEIIEIAEPELVDFEVSYSDVTCHGENNGTITVSNLSEGAYYTIQLNGYGPDLSGQSYFGPGIYLVLARLEGNTSRYSYDLESVARYDDPCQKARLITINEPKLLSCEILADFNMDNLRCRSTNQTYLTAVATNGTGNLSYSWELNALRASWAIVSEANEPIIHFKPGVGPATFTVTVTDENGCQTECSIDVTSTCRRGNGVSFAPSFAAGSRNNQNDEDYYEFFDAQIYPNPIKDKLNIKFDEELTSDVTIEIFDLVGYVVFKNIYNPSESNNLAIDFSKFKSQVYYVKITTDQGIVIKQVVMDK